PQVSYPSPEGMGHEMPDLDLLVNTTGLSQPMPVAASPARTPRKGTFVVAVNDGDATEAVEVMTVLRDVVDGRLIVQMGDKAYQSVSSDRDFQERFNKVMRELGQNISQPATSPVQSASAQVEMVELQPEASAPAEETSTPSVEPEAAAPSLADPI